MPGKANAAMPVCRGSVTKNLCLRGDGRRSGLRFYGKPAVLAVVGAGQRCAPHVVASATVVNVLNNQYRKDNSNSGYPFFDYSMGADPQGRRAFVSLSYKF